MFPTLAQDARVRMEFLEHSNHLFTLRAHQEALISVVESWMRETNGSAAPGLDPARFTAGRAAPRTLGGARPRT